MADASFFGGFLIFSHILPALLALLGVILIANGIMDRKNEYTIGGIALFFAAGILPFIVLPLMINV
ncbi:MAG: hypothetical protein ACPK7O_10350 [Methanobacterium sp.]